MGEEFKGSSTCEWKTATVRNEVTGFLDGQLAIRANNCVAADYEGAWYIGQVQQNDEQDGEVEVSFMTKGKGKATASLNKCLVVGKKEYSLCCRGSHSCRQNRPPLPVNRGKVCAD